MAFLDRVRQRMTARNAATYAVVGFVVGAHVYRQNVWHGTEEPMYSSGDCFGDGFDCDDYPFPKRHPTFLKTHAAVKGVRAGLIWPFTLLQIFSGHTRNLYFPNGCPPANRC
jgi:hypothetical protein